MATAPENPAQDLARAFRALSAKANLYRTRWAYYDGEQPLRYASPALAKKFARLVEHYTANWCGVVVDSLTDRLDISGVSHKDKAVADALSAAWTAGALDIEADDVHQSISVCGEAFIIADTVDDAGAEAFFAQPPELCHVFYDATNPKLKAFAAKWWTDDADGRRYLTLYYEDRFLHFATRAKSDGTPVALTSPKVFIAHDAEPETPNPWAPLLPVFHFRYERRKTRGELQNIIDSQDGYNKLFADMMMASEYGGFPQRYAISNADTSDLKNAPDELWEIPAGEPGEQPTSVGQFSATDLANFTNAMDAVASTIAVRTRTPKHYLLKVNDPSGEALMAMEAPLVKKAKTYMRRLDVTWREVAAFMLARAGITTEPESIGIVWNDPRTVQPIAEGQARDYAIRAGIPLQLWLKRAEGWTDEDLQELKTAQEVADAAAKTSMGEALLRAMRASNEPEGATVPASESAGAGDTANV